MQPRPVSYVLRFCSLDSFPASNTRLFHPLHHSHHNYLRQYGWPTCFCLVLPTGPAMTRFPFLFCMSLLPLGHLPSLLLPRLSRVMTKPPFCLSHTVLLWFRVMVMQRFLSCAPAFLTFPPSPPLLLFALSLPHRLAADALSGMVNTGFLLLLL
jgi:hypothetical protein